MRVDYGIHCSMIPVIVLNIEAKGRTLFTCFMISEAEGSFGWMGIGVVFTIVLMNIEGTYPFKLAYWMREY